MDFMEYYRIIKKNKQEFDDFFLIVVINVIEFFRDLVVWKIFERKVFLELIEYKCKYYDIMIRIWSVVCLIGQELYLIVMFFSEFLGDDFKRYRFKIFVIDIDREVLNIVIRGVYFKEIVEKSVLKLLIKKYFFFMGDYYCIFFQIWRYVEFRYFNFFLDRYFMGFDMIFIRNVFIYMIKEV